MEQLVVDHYAAPQDCQLGEVHGRVKCHMLGKMWTFWGGASAASYLLAPPQWQPSAAAAAAVLWSAYVSYRLHHPAPEEAEMANASAIDDYLCASIAPTGTTSGRAEATMARPAAPWIARGTSSACSVRGDSVPAELPLTPAHYRVCFELVSGCHLAAQSPVYILPAREGHITYSHNVGKP